MSLYHIDVYMPDGLKMLNGKYMLQYSQHALNASRNDRYGNIKLPETLHTSSYRVIEVETDNYRRVIKVVYRCTMSKTHDLSIVCIPEANGWMFVKTVWANHHLDEHKTLDRSKYARI